MQVNPIGRAVVGSTTSGVHEPPGARDAAAQYIAYLGAATRVNTWGSCALATRGLDLTPGSGFRPSTSRQQTMHALCGSVVILG
jgi:hypothetical protein